jgi:hypothetical protein
MVAVRKAAKEPEIMERIPNLAKSWRLLGAIPPMPAIMMPREPKLAKPQRA